MILAAGLTPAWQQIFVFGEFRAGAVNRAAEAVWCASGKVLNVGCALHHLGAPSHTISPVGGLTGEAIRRDFAALDVPATWIETESPTRVCTTLLDRATGQTTELVENSRPLSGTELNRFAAAFSELTSRAALVVLSGSLPQGAPADFLHRLMQPLRVPVLLDVRGPELTACLPLRPWLVKPNREELAATAGRPLTTDADVQAALRALHAEGAEHVVVSDGPDTLWALGPDGIERFAPPRVNVVNPIGCGDCLAAGIAAAHFTGRSFHDSVAFGIAAAGENAGLLLPARLQRTAVKPSGDATAPDGIDRL